MAEEQTAQNIFVQLEQQARCLWGEGEMARQAPGLRQTAEEIAAIHQPTLPPDLEPRFF